MQQRLTELWLGLLGRGGGQLAVEDDPAHDVNRFSEQDREDIRGRFATLKWTNVRLVKTDQLVAVDVSDLADDIIDARESALVEQHASGESHDFVFDPKAFQEEHPDLTMQEYELDESTLLSWAKRVTAVRS